MTPDSAWPAQEREQQRGSGSQPALIEAARQKVKGPLQPGLVATALAQVLKRRRRCCLETCRSK